MKRSEYIRIGQPGYKVNPAYGPHSTRYGGAGATRRAVATTVATCLGLLLLVLVVIL